MGVTLLGVLSFFLGFAPYAKFSNNSDTDLPSSIDFFNNGSGGAGVAGLGLLFAAAAFGLLPGQRTNGSVIAGPSLAGFASLLFLVIGIERGLEAGVGLILVLVASFLQAVLAIANVLAPAGIIRAGAAPYSYPPPPYGGGPPPLEPYGRRSGSPDHQGRRPR